MTEKCPSPLIRLTLTLDADPDLVEEMPIEEARDELEGSEVGRHRVFVLLLSIYRLIKETRLVEDGYSDRLKCVVKAQLEPERLGVLPDEHEDMTKVEARLKAWLDMSETPARSGRAGSTPFSI